MGRCASHLLWQFLVIYLTNNSCVNFMIVRRRSNLAYNPSNDHIIAGTLSGRESTACRIASRHNQYINIYNLQITLKCIKKERVLLTLLLLPLASTSNTRESSITSASLFCFCVLFHTKTNVFNSSGRGRSRTNMLSGEKKREL